jgi:hypothetical protein
MADIPKNAIEFAEQINDECVALVSPGSTPTKSFLLAKCTELITARDAEREQLVAAAALEKAVEHREVWIEADPNKPDDLIQGYGACSCGQLKADGITRWEVLWRNHILSLIPDAGKLLAELKRKERREEAEWWFANGEDHEFVGEGHCNACERLAALREGEPAVPALKGEDDVTKKR